MLTFLNFIKAKRMPFREPSSTLGAIAFKKPFASHLLPGWRLLLATIMAFAMFLAPGASKAKPGLNVAVAANFLSPALEISETFEAETGIAVTISSGSTGKFYAQIRHGAPFDVFLAADSESITKLIDQGWAVANDRLTYAVGQLVLWSPDSEQLSDQETAVAVLQEGRFDRLAMANPLVAPYGAAAQDVLAHLNLASAWPDKRIQGQSIGQAYQFVASGNADLGFVALSQTISTNGDDPPVRGSTWLPPQSWYRPLTQDAARLTKSTNPEQARAFLRFLRSPDAKAIMARYGYQP